MKESVAILCGGGPAPGINSVISSVALVFLKSGYRVMGIHEGYKGLFADNPKLQEIDFTFADDIHKQGGSALQMSRFKPKDSDFSTRFFTENNVQLLVTIGGDDTASTANRISKYLKEHDVDIQNIHVPKTIDNDLPLPEDTPTFGYQSAKHRVFVLHKPYTKMPAPVATGLLFRPWDAKPGTWPSVLELPHMRP